jgi:hypothetical protein
MKKSVENNQKSMSKIANEPLLCSVKFIETKIEEGLNKYDIEHWANDKITENMIKTLPAGWAIVKSGRVRVGDMMYGYDSGWDTIVSEDIPGWFHYLGYDKKGTEIGHFCCVARRISNT